MENKKPFNIPNSGDSIKNDYDNNLITLYEAACEFYKCGFTNYINLDYAKGQLNIEKTN